MFSIWSKIKTSAIAFLAILLPILGVVGYVMGNRRGREAVENDMNEEILDDVYIAKKARESVDARGDDDLRDSANRWVRKTSDK